MFKHILAPTDGSALSRTAVGKAVAFAAEIGARITFYYAWPEHKGYLFGEGALDNRMSQDEFAAAMKAQGEEILAEAAAVAREAGVACDRHAEATDTPHAGIIAAAGRSGCDVVFMASHGRRGVGGLLLGSETMKVLTHSKIPVLVYR
jgi:nucleotide-binding universal stress UspA family protein